MSQNLTTLFVVAAALVSAPQAAQALSCKDAQTESIRRVITLNEDILVSTGDVTAGKLLWRSENLTVSFRCVDDYERRIGELAFLYWDPTDTLAQIHPSLEVGVTVHSIDRQAVRGQRLEIGWGTKQPFDAANCRLYWNTSQATACATPQVVTVNFSAFIRATGAPPPPSGQIDSTGAYDLFQVDGVEGLNDKPNSNYRAAISGLGRIRFIYCNPEIHVRANAGNAVDFGRLPATSALAGEVARSIPFGVEVNMSGPHAGNQCNNRALVASFSTSHPVHDNTAIMPASDSGFGIVLSNARNSSLSEIAMNTAVPIGIINNTVMYHDFVASLKWLSDTPRIGPFTATATINVTFR